MTKDREKARWFDLTVAAISPVLIMGLVGSLAFFLLDILYAGQYSGRLAWTLFFFVGGAVLVARIAIEVHAAQARLYGLLLGGAVFLAMLKYMDYSSVALATVGWLINLTIVLIVFWSANKLVWNCTFLDEKDADPGRGLLAEAVASPPPESARAALPSQTQVAKQGKSPGLSVIYFTVAAFPLFGLGQSLIPAEDSDRRRYAFMLMSIYVACGLGLLLTTTLLGLRRYLRQRRLNMPAGMTGLWLATGAGLIALLMAFASFFPRPHAEYALIALTPVGSSEANASRFGVGNMPGKGKGKPGAKEKGDAQAGSGQGQEGGKDSGESGKPEGGSGDGQSGGGGQGGRDGDRCSGNQGKSGAESSGGSKPGSTSGLSDKILNAVKWAVLLLLGIPLLLFLLVFFLRNLDSLPAWLRKWLDALAAWWQALCGRRSAQESDIEPAEVVRPPRPFRSFSNPFADGSAAHRSPDDLVRYSFAALDAWASEHDLARQEEETPREFVVRLGVDVPDLADASWQLCTHYANLAYGRRHVPESARPQIEQLWLGLDAAQVVTNRFEEA